MNKLFAISLVFILALFLVGEPKANEQNIILKCDPTLYELDYNNAPLEESFKALDPAFNTNTTNLSAYLNLVKKGMDRLVEISFVGINDGKVKLITGIELLLKDSSYSKYYVYRDNTFSIQIDRETLIVETVEFEKSNSPQNKVTLGCVIIDSESGFSSLIEKRVNDLKGFIEGVKNEQLKKNKI